MTFSWTPAPLRSAVRLTVRAGARLSLLARPMLEGVGALAWARRRVRGPRNVLRQLAAEIIDPAGAPGTAQVSYQGREITIRPGEVVGRDLAYGFGFESLEMELWSALVRPDDVVFDVGANVGLYSLAAAVRLSHAGKVVAFEPNPETMVLLRQNLLPLASTCAVSFEARAVGARRGTATLHCTRDSAYSGLVDTRREQTVRTVEVPVTTLDEAVDEHALPRVDLLKFDVEGYEPELVMGARELLSRADAPIIFAEIARENLGPRGLRQLAVIEALEGYGYEVRVAAPGLPLRSTLDWSSGSVAPYDYVALKPARRDRLERWIAP